MQKLFLKMKLDINFTFWLITPFCLLLLQEVENSLTGKSIHTMTLKICKYSSTKMCCLDLWSKMENPVAAILNPARSTLTVAKN